MSEHFDFFENLDIEELISSPSQHSSFYEGGARVPDQSAVEMLERVEHWDYGIRIFDDPVPTHSEECDMEEGCDCFANIATVPTAAEAFEAGGFNWNFHLSMNNAVYGHWYGPWRCETDLRVEFAGLRFLTDPHSATLAVHGEEDTSPT